MPTPSADPFEDFLGGYPAEIQAIAQAARSLIRELLPGALEMVDPPSKIVAYGTSHRYAGLVCAIAPYRGHVNLMLSRGASLPDPHGLLSGTGKKARHIRLLQPADLQRPGVRELILAGAKD